MHDVTVWGMTVHCGHCGNRRHFGVDDDTDTVAMRARLKRLCYCARCEAKGLERRTIVEPRWTDPLGRVVHGRGK